MWIPPKSHGTFPDNIPSNQPRGFGVSTKTIRGVRAYQFDDFELDVRSGELRRGGELVRLQEQPCRLLMMLLEHPGEVVLREEIRKRLWPNDTVVEISHGINATALRLRDALGESAEYPRRIETVTRRGYRFKGEVDVVCKTPASAVLRPGLDTANLSGQTLSHFRILGRLGVGGMGVVYRAEDLKLGRHVALKFLPPELAADATAVARFQREARTASAPSHPNVCTVYSVEDCGEQPAIVMELLEGETLEARLQIRGALAVEEASAIAMAILGALDTAHRKGIVHRDLKPANVVLTDSAVKVLDFGLAKMARSAGVTQTGSIVGTPNYMAPELLHGAEADASSDLYSFGIMLREMLTGSHVPGEGAPIPGALHAIIERCTAPARERRWQSAGDLRAAWSSGVGLLALPACTLPPAKPRTAFRRRYWMATAAVAICAMALVTTSRIPHLPSPIPQSRPSASRILVTAAGAIQRLNLSPDGRSLAFVAGGRLFVRDLETDRERYIQGAENPGTPFWSPDGRWIAFVTGDKLKKVPVEGGLSQTLGTVNTNLAGAWSHTGDILIGQIGDGLYGFRDSGGPVTRLTAPDAAAGEARHMMPQFLPDGRRFLYVAASGNAGNHILYATFVGSEKREPIMRLESGALYTQGHLLYILDRQIMAQTFDPATLRRIGEPYPVGGPVLTRPAAAASLSVPIFSASGRTIAYSPASTQGEIVIVHDWAK